MTEPAPALRHPVRYRLEAALANLLFALLSLAPADVVSNLGGWLGRKVGPKTKAHRTAIQNMERALPQLNDQERENTILDAWENFGRTMTEYAVLERLYTLDPRIEVEGYNALADLAKAGKPAILFGAHLGNWETVPIALALKCKPLVIVYRAANNPLVDKIVSGIRRRYTSAMAPKGSAGARQVLKALGAGHHVFMVVDQKSNTGMEIPFFGRNAYTGTAVARMAARFGCPVFPVRTERLSGLRFKVTIEAPWTFTDESDDGVRAALGQINERVEEWVRTRPGQWLWMHKRWPT